jgi:hypothetical protein
LPVRGIQDRIGVHAEEGQERLANDCAANRSRAGSAMEIEVVA